MPAQTNHVRIKTLLFSRISVCIEHYYSTHLDSRNRSMKCLVTSTNQVWTDIYATMRLVPFCLMMKTGKALIKNLLRSVLTSRELIRGQDRKHYMLRWCYTTFSINVKTSIKNLIAYYSPLSLSCFSAGPPQATLPRLLKYSSKQ